MIGQSHVRHVGMFLTTIERSHVHRVLFLIDPVRSSTKYHKKYNKDSTYHMPNNLKNKTIPVQYIKFRTPHKQCLTHYPV
jgi:hypothetical protein